jgi:hypothetical protein
MNDSISSSFVFDKSNSRFSILNIYGDSDDFEDFKSLSKNPENIKKQFKKTILKKQAFKTNKCYCCIM